MSNQIRRLCIFCGSSAGNRPAYRRAAEEIGSYLAKNEIAIVFGGGKVGLMGIVADSALAAGGEVIGVIPEHLMGREVGHCGLTKLHVVASMHERKALMADLSDAFLALPGGFGTFDEFCEVLTWSQLGLHQKPCGLLNVEGYFTPVLAMFDRAVADGFLRKENREIVLASDNLPEMMDKMRSWHPVVVEKWLDREAR
jgi:uncharacterized protein (TIGR00730 family)